MLALLTNRFLNPPPPQTLPPSFGCKFSFEPEAGTLPPGATAQIAIRLCSDVRGPFEEAFNWHVRGGAAPVPLIIRGRVIGPTFELDSRELDFGIVSFGFRCGGVSCFSSCSTLQCWASVLACLSGPGKRHI